MLVAENISKRFDGAARSALDRFSLSVPEGTVVALLGPSGCGKSTFLNIVAGLAKPDGGRLAWRDEDVGPLPPERRRFGLMFQDYALFPHLDVLANVSFGPIEAGLGKSAVEARARLWLDRLGLAERAASPVWALSGGQRQRVALARALAAEPRLLLLDEPLSNLDRQLRFELQGLLVRVLPEAAVCTLLVTHDQAEAFALADRVAIMRDGRIVQEGPPDWVWRHPRDAWTARFLGHGNVTEDCTILDEAYRFEGPEGAMIETITASGATFELTLGFAGEHHRLTLSRREVFTLGGGGPPAPGTLLPFRVVSEGVHRFASA